MGGRQWTVLLASAFVLAASACTPALRDGVYACTDDTTCPAGFFCGGGRCRNAQGSECRLDFECDDFSPCTDDLCEDGFCEHVASEAANGLPCEDGLFCNGLDVCREGRCTNEGPPPCPECTEETQCGGTCGVVGTPCCAGLCFEGVCDGSCVSCGGEGELCCPDLFAACTDGLGCDFTSLRCTACGGPDAPCCATGPCVPGYVCDIDSAIQSGSLRCVLAEDVCGPCGPDESCGLRAVPDAPPDTPPVAACVGLGTPYGPCRPDGSCDAPGTCVFGFCTVPEAAEPASPGMP